MRATIPIVNSLQRFDETKVAYNFESDPSAGTDGAGFKFIDPALRTDAGPEMENLIMWSDNSQAAYITQRPPIKRAKVFSEGLSAGTTLAAEILADSPVGFWRLNESSGTTAEDESGSANEHDGTYTATTTVPKQGALSLVAGSLNMAVDFSTGDTTSRITVPDHADLENSSAFTVECIFTPTTDDLTGTKILVGKGALNDEWELYLSSGNLAWRTSTGIAIIGATDLVAGTTYYAVGVHEAGNTARLYLNASEDVASAVHATRETSANPMAIGNVHDGSGSNNFTGIIDEVAVYQSALSSARITAHNTARTADYAIGGSALGRGGFRTTGTLAGPGRQFVVIGNNISSQETTEAGFIRSNGSTTNGEIPDGFGKVYIDQISNDSIVVLSEENNSLYQYTGNFGRNLTGFLPERARTNGLTKGVVYHNGRIYIMDKEGFIYSSGANNFISWNALDFLNAEREFDGGQFLIKHHNAIVAFGTRTIEFFVDNANPTGSPLIPRREIFYRIGVIGEVARIEDTLYFIGQAEGTDYALYKLDKFTLTKISDDRTSYKIEAMATGASLLNVTGFTMQNRHMISLVQININDDDVADPDTLTHTVIENLFFDTHVGALYRWTSSNADLDPKIIASSTSGNFINHQGTAILMRPLLSTTMEDDNSPDVTTNNIPVTPIAISWKARSQNMTMESHLTKYWDNLGIEGTFGHRQSTSDPVDITLSWSDDFYETFEGSTVIDFASQYKFSEYGLGSSQHRAWQISGNSKARVFLQNWVFVWNEGDS